MKQYIQAYWPELLIGVCTIFFAFRELGTFPSAWLDDSLFMLVAQNLAEGRGYVLPVLTESWHYSYVLGVGPTVIFPAALFIKLFGFSVTVARLPFAALLCATAVLMYKYVYRIAGRHAARLSTGLLVSFSAFVNTGKPVLGEILAFFFIVLGFYVLLDAKTFSRQMLVGFFFGLAVISKITFGIIFPVIGLVGLYCIARKHWQPLLQWLFIGVVSVVTFGAWRIFEMMSAPGAFLEILQYGLAGGGEETLQVLRNQPELLLRFQYVYFGVLLLFFCIGIWKARKKIGDETVVCIVGFVALFILYFLNGPGWYRHILPAHLLLLPFVFVGMRSVLPRYFALALVIFFIGAQGLWQWDHRGSTGIREAEIAAAVLLDRYPNTKMVIQQPEIYIRLPFVDYRYFLTEEMSKRDFVIFEDLPLSQEEYCLPLVVKISPQDRVRFPDRIHDLYGRFVLIDPPVGCASTL